MTCEGMRSQLVSVYPGERWRNRVACMPDRQVIAIYKRMKQKGELRKHERKSFEKAEQITIWELFQ